MVLWNRKISSAARNSPVLIFLAFLLLFSFFLFSRFVLGFFLNIVGFFFFFLIHIFWFSNYQNRTYP